MPQLISLIMPAQACRHDENVLLIDEIFRLKLTPGFINNQA
jgi:hypothetical protein